MEDNKETTTVAKLKKGYFFCLKSQGQKEIRDSKIWIRGNYVRSEGKYEIIKFSDMSHSRLVNGNTPAFLNFVF